VNATGDTQVAVDVCFDLMEVLQLLVRIDRVWLQWWWVLPCVQMESIDGSKSKARARRRQHGSDRTNVTNQKKKNLQRSKIDL
jgi:hypothetical protein